MGEHHFQGSAQGESRAKNVKVNAKELGRDAKEKNKRTQIFIK